MRHGRRQFLAMLALAGGALACGAAAVWRYGEGLARTIPGRIMGASSVIGHRLRDGKFPAPSRTLNAAVVIVGGGIAGLTAAYRLSQSGMHDFLLLELEPEAGGNSSSGENAVSAYPWGAHYVPLLTRESVVPRRLFEDFGIIKGYDEKDRPIYNEYFLCADPQERLFMLGRWQDGIVPSFAITPETDAQYKRFFAHMDAYRKMRGKDGKPAFAIPVDASSQDAELLALDRLTMREWMDAHGYVAEELRWYVNYCCRDDYGATEQETSAWAGVHYFASRNGDAANAEAGALVTWPEGNGWLAHQLEARVQEQLRTQAVVYEVNEQGRHVTVDYYDPAKDESVRVEAKAAIIAVPRFVAARIVRSERYAVSDESFGYSPWAVANVTLDALPEGHGAHLAWDNVAYRSPLLGYVVATHQVTQMQPTHTVLTYYWPLSHLPPAQARQEALARSYEEWQRLFTAELLALHPELKGRILNFDLKLWGHAMIRPTRGFVWGEARRRAQRQHGPIFFAHSDMSGISIFEEASTRGHQAAEAVLKWI